MLAGEREGRNCLAFGVGFKRTFSQEDASQSPREKGRVEETNSFFLACWPGRGWERLSLACGEGFKRLSANRMHATPQQRKAE